MEVPLVLSCIDVVEERIKSCGFTKENCGIYLFDVNDYIKLAEGISLAIENKKDYLERQQKFAKSLLSWSWKDAAKEYYNILFEKTEK